MDNLGIIDQFLETFTLYIDSGFGLLAPNVAFLTTAIVTIDIVLAGLFWAYGSIESFPAAFLKKVLFVGFFALVLNNFPLFANLIFNSFGQLGLNATGGTLTADDLLRPGFIADVGFAAGHPLLTEIDNLTGPIAFFVNIVTITILFLAWIITLFAFFFLAIQLFVTIIEFKLTTLAGFVLIPFALWNKTAFLAERVLGNIIASGIKLMVLAIIVGIGSTLFGQITAGFTPGEVGLDDAVAVILGSLAILALGVFGPGIATGLVSGAPQLGAGAAVGTAIGVGAGIAAGGAGAAGAAKAGGQATVGAVKAGASLSGGVGAAFSLGKAASGQTGLKGAMAGASAVAQAGAGVVGDGAKRTIGRATEGVKQAFQGGGRKAFSATGGSTSSGGASAGKADGGGGGAGSPAWAKQAKRQQTRRDAATAGQAALAGARGGGGDASPSIKQDEE
jgi:type IV secretion system protein TrbL